jgi:phosphinothricin acetyltransferase
MMSDSAFADRATIRASTEADMKAVTAIYAHYVLHSTVSFETEAPTLAEMVRRRAALLAQGFPHIVAEIDGAVVGYAYAGTYRARSAYRSTVENTVYLHPDALRRGLGRQLLAAVIDACAASGFRQMIAVIGGATNIASVRLHAALGFRHVGVIESVGFKHGTWLPTTLMQRALGAADTIPPTVAE